MSRIMVLSLFAAGALGFLGVALLSRRPESRIPGFGAVVGFVMRYQLARLPIGRIVLLGLWWWIGWHFFAR